MNNECIRYDEEHANPRERIACFSLIGIFVILVWTLVFYVIFNFAGCRTADASTINDRDAILSVIGEAENQNYKGLLAVACAIRNRGTLHGVYGLRNPRVTRKLYSQKTFDLAKKAWKQSAKIDITNGATHWENINAFGCPAWVKGCVEVFRYKDHVFYREVRS